MPKPTSKKGEVAEESLRNYFINQGFFVVRSVPFKYSIHDITDIDLWLYSKSSQITRERINVDIKRKRTPQAIERIFWTKGLQQVLNLDRCIVATTDARKETREFGEVHGVSVLGGQFLAEVIKYYNNKLDRISEEQLYEKFNTSCIINSKIVFKNEYQKNKQVLLGNLNFIGCNKYLSQINLFIEEYLSSDKKSEAALRLLYLSVAYFLIALDYVSKTIIQLDKNNRIKELSDGFRYGEAGPTRAEEIFNTSKQLIAKMTPGNLLTEDSIEREIREQLQKFPAETLSEYFAKNDVNKKLFDLAIEFENIAFKIDLIKVSELEPEQKSVIAVLIDFFKIDRKKIL